jgi:hypothetical protein
VQLKLQIRSLHGIKSLNWQGDTQALSLTSPVDANSPDGWSVIMPAWNSEPGRATAGTCRWWWKIKRVSASHPMRSRWR